MNNQPVAWTDGKGNYFDKNSFFPVDDLTPLYTHPAKILTEWEIKECWEEATEMQEHFCSQYFDFAKLILKKASEK
jgi:hypothetical protein